MRTHVKYHPENRTHMQETEREYHINDTEYCISIWTKYFKSRVPPFFFQILHLE